MQQKQHILKIKTPGPGFIDVTGRVRNLVDDSGVQSGLCHLFVRHTSASLVIQENADPDVLRDLTTFMGGLVPESGFYRHKDEGPDDMPAHIRSVLTKTSEVVPIVDGRLGLGTWQAVYLWEHRRKGHERDVIVHIVGE